MVDNVWLIDNMKSLIHVFMYKIKQLNVALTIKSFSSPACLENIYFIKAVECLEFRWRGGV